MIAPTIIWCVWSPDTNPNTVFEGVRSCRDYESGLAPRRDPETDPILSHWATLGRRSTIFQRWIYTCSDPRNIQQLSRQMMNIGTDVHLEPILSMLRALWDCTWASVRNSRVATWRGEDRIANQNMDMYGHVKTWDSHPCPSWVFFLGGVRTAKNSTGMVKHRWS